MAQHNELGKEGEAFAQNYLAENGFEIVDKNWRFQNAEIDIVAKKDGVLVFIEVKTRSSLDFGLPKDFVKPSKVQTLVKAADAYVSMNNIDSEIRFDIVGIFKNAGQFELEHIEDAFYFF